MSQQTYPRFSRAQRIEHVVLLTSFTLLALTGLPQKFSGEGWAQGVIRLLGGIETIRLIHRVAAVVLMLEVVYHVVSVGYRLFVRRLRPSMLPTVGDVGEALGMLLYNLGVRKTKPQAGRYTFGEKLEYWAVVWGTLVMMVTGFMMWNPIATTNLLPGQIVPAAKAAHGGEALLAVLAIIVWHMYHVHVRHFNKSMFTGRVTEHEMLDEHPKELADIKAGLATRPLDPAQAKKRQQRYLPVAGVVAAVMLFGLFQFVTFEKTAIDTVPQRGGQQDAFLPLTPTPVPTPRPSPTPIPLLPVWEDNLAVFFQLRCGDCHGGTAGLDFASYASALRGSDNGPVIVPGDPDNSLIVQKLSNGHAGGISDPELDVLKAWIAAGAPER